MSPSGEETQYARLELGLFSLGGDSYNCALRYFNPKSIAGINPVSATISIKLDDLAKPELSHLEYGQTLSEMVFVPDGTLFSMFGKVMAASQSAVLKLRVCIHVEPSAAGKLRSVRWELLTVPGTAERTPSDQTGTTGTGRRTVLGTAKFIASDQNILLSRYMTSDDWTPVPRRAGGKLTCLVAVSAPPDLQELHPRLALVDGPLWFKIAADKLEKDTDIEYLGRDEPLSFKALSDKLSSPIDVLYLVCHGEYKPDAGPTLILQKEETGSPETVPGTALVDRIRTLQVKPKLVLLISCESAAGHDPDLAEAREEDGVPTLASGLAEAGVLAVVAMRGKITMKSMEAAVPKFLEVLMDDGQIDRALAEARFAMSGRKDFWIPALYSRLEDGCLWYKTRFGVDETDDFKKWKGIFPQIERGTFVPILGPNINEPVYGDVASLAIHLAEKFEFPLSPFHRRELPHVAQYIVSKVDSGGMESTLVDAIKARVLERHTEIPAEDSNELPDIWDFLIRSGVETYQLLASLNGSVYVTAVHDTLLNRALLAQNRKPELVACKWRGRGAGKLTPPKIKNVRPKPATPLVYHVLGVFGEEDSLVITEDDHYDYTIATAQYNLLPPLVRSSLVDSSLFFLGFQLTDLSFRVLFRLIRSLEGYGKAPKRPHIGVQVNPDQHDFADVAEARAYLLKYYGEASSIDIYWGTALEFLRDLNRHLKGANIEPSSRAANAKGVGNVG